MKGQMVCEISQLTSGQLHSPIGLLTIQACHNGIHKIEREKPTGKFVPFELDQDKMEMKLLSAATDVGSPSVHHLKIASNWLRSYFLYQGQDQNAEELVSKKPQLCLPSKDYTEFEKSVWIMLEKSTGFGETLTYGQLAGLINNPSKNRKDLLSISTVGTALKKNPVLIFVPCHRVVKSDGQIGKYGGTEAGSEVKQFLLNHESQKES